MCITKFFQTIDIVLSNNILILIAVFMQVFKMQEKNEHETDGRKAHTDVS